MSNLIIVYQQNFTYHDYYKKSFENLVSKGIDIYIFVKNSTDKVISNGIYQKSFNNYNNLIAKIKNNNLHNSFFLSFEEHSIELINKLKKELNQTYTTNYKAFINKNLQRKLLLNYDKSISINFKELDLNNLKNANKYLDFPFIIKPVTSAQSRGVSIINNNNDLENYIENYKNILKNLKNAGYKNEKFLIEEFIDGKAFSCDYFVNEKGDFKIAKPIFLEFGREWGIDDFCNISRIINSETEKMLNLDLLKEFIEKNIKALDIKNTFIHHEFKVTNKGELKTIELNGRIGGFRLDMYDICYNLNLLEYPFIKQTNSFDEKELQTNYIIFAIYPKKEGVLTGAKLELIEKIKKLKSFERIKILDSKIGQKAGPSKLGYSKIGIIRLKNKNLEEINKDFNFIKEIYFDLLYIR